MIDGATNSTTTVGAGSNPIAVAVNPVTNKIYVANYSSNTVTVIDGATNSTATVSVGNASPRRGRQPGDKQNLRGQYGQRQRHGD